MANEAVLKEVLSDEAFVKELLEMENPEDVRDALNAKGAEITVEEVKDIAKALNAQAEGELNEDALEDVAGGVIGGLVALTLGLAAAIGITKGVDSGGRRW